MRYNQHILAFYWDEVFEMYLEQYDDYAVVVGDLDGVDSLLRATGVF